MPKIPRRPAPPPPTPTRRTPRTRKGPGRTFDPAIHCGAQLRKKERGRVCTNYKGFKTPHPGEGKCWLHGGLTPIKHGLNSLIKHGRLKDMLQKMREIDHDLLDLSPEIELLRAMTIDFVNRYEEFWDALEAWYDKLDDNNRDNDLPPVKRKYPELEDAGALLEAISRMAERMGKIGRDGSITLDVFRGLMTQMGMVVAQNVTDSATLDAIEKQWSELLVNPRSFVKNPTPQGETCDTE